LSATPRTVVLVHGLWMGAWALGILKRRLIGSGLRVRRFHYATTRRSFEGSASELARLLRRSADEGRVGLVAHSLGGLLALAAIAQCKGVRGRAVLLGTPLRGSWLAHRVHGWPGGDTLLGHSALALKGGTRVRPPPGWSVAMIAGDRQLGIGLLAGGHRVPSDGTVALAETRASFLDQHRVLRETHTTLITSRRVARLAARYLAGGSLQDDEKGAAP